MPSKKLSPQHRRIETFFLMKEEATVQELYEAIYERPMECSMRRASQALGPVFTRYHKATGNDVQPTGTPYTYKLVYA
jgi:hypothetical protein